MFFFSFGTFALTNTCGNSFITPANSLNDFPLSLRIAATCNAVTNPSPVVL